MKLSMEIYEVAQKLGDRDAIDAIKEAGFDAIDYSYYYEKDCEDVLGENYKTYAEELRAYLDRSGIVCNQAHAPFSFKAGMNFDTSEENYLHIVRAIESASILGAKNIVVHSVSVPEGEDFMDYNVAYYSSFIPYCEAFGICVAVENLFRRDKKRNCYAASKLGTPEDLNEIVRRINSPKIVACVDLGHAALTGFEPEEFIRRTDVSILKCLHVQDNDYQGDRHVIPYGGLLNWSAIMTALKEKGYEGDLTLEIVKYVQRFPKELLPDALKLAASVGRHLISIYEQA